MRFGWMLAPVLLMAACQSKSPEEIARERGLGVEPRNEVPALELSPEVLKVMRDAEAEFSRLEVARLSQPKSFDPTNWAPRGSVPEYVNMRIDGRNLDELTDSANAAMAKMPEDVRANFSQIFRFLVIEATKSPEMQMKAAQENNVSDEHLFMALYQLVGGKTTNEIVEVADRISRIRGMSRGQAASE